MGNNISEQKSIAGLRANAAAFIINLSFFMGLGLLIPIFALILEDKNNDFKIISSGGIILLKGKPNEFENIFDNW